MSTNETEETKPISSHLDQTGLVNQEFITWKLFRLYIKYYTFISIRKYFMTAGLREQASNVTQSWPLKKCKQEPWFLFPAIVSAIAVKSLQESLAALTI